MHNKRSVLFILFSIWLTLGFCQEKTKNEDAPAYIEEVDSYFENGEYKMALKYYLNFYSQDSSDYELNYKIGVCMYNLRQYRGQELPFLERAVNGKTIEANYYLGRSYHLLGRFDEAMRVYTKYKKTKGIKEFSNEEVDRLITKSITAAEMMQAPVNVTIENMGSAINSAYPDYVPLISADESVLIFTSRRPEGTCGLQDANGDYYEDLYISYKTDSGWSAAKGLSKNINSDSHDASVALSPGGEKMIIFRTNKELLGGDLYLSTFDGNDWSVPQMLPPEINAPKSWQASACFTTDESTLYFSSNRSGGRGGKDLYRVVKLPNGKWSKPTNLGKTINTKYDEDAPFMHPDGKTLYFSSKGYKNMGEYDIFKSVLQDNGTWSPPENMGYPINTVDDDIYFVLSTNGKRGYYSSDKNAEGYGGIDLYMISFPDERKDLIVVKGLVASSDLPAKLLAAEITVVDQSTNEEQGIYNSNPSTGKFLLVLQPEKKYTMIVKSAGYHGYTQDLFFQSAEEETMKSVVLDKK